MNQFTKAKLAALALFVAISGGFVTYHFMYIAPGRECESKGLWWAQKWRRCVAPIAVSDITRRPNPTLPPELQNAPAPQ